MDKLLTEEIMPCWYELSWRKKPPTIVLRIHKETIEKIENLIVAHPLTVGLGKRMGFKKFQGDFNKNLGFDGIFKREGEDNEFVGFLIELPIIAQTGEKCNQCDGSGRNEEDDYVCLYCNGKGKRTDYHWDSAEKISASFTVISTLLYFQKQEEETTCPTPQLLKVITSTDKGAHGGSLHGEYSVPLCRLLRTIGKRNTIPEMVEAMKTAYGHMFLKDAEPDGNSIMAYVSDDHGWLNVSCPGNACGLHPIDGHQVQKNLGYEFGCHNVDCPNQQLTLLAGLAALHDKARKEIKTY